MTTLIIDDFEKTLDIRAIRAAKQELAVYKNNDNIRKAHRETRKQKHPCTGCVWGRWQGDVMYCMMPRCWRSGINE